MMRAVIAGFFPDRLDEGRAHGLADPEVSPDKGMGCGFGVHRFAQNAGTLGNGGFRAGKETPLAPVAHLGKLHETARHHHEGAESANGLAGAATGAFFGIDHGDEVGDLVAPGFVGLDEKVGIGLFHIAIYQADRNGGRGSKVHRHGGLSGSALATGNG